MADNALTSPSAWPELDGCWSDDADRVDFFDHDDDPTPVIARRPILPSSFPPPSTPIVHGPDPTGGIDTDDRASVDLPANGAPAGHGVTGRWWTRFTRSRSL